MSRKHYFMRCPGCGAPAADHVRICPYCGRATGFENLSVKGIERTEGGGMRIGGGAQLVIGRPEEGPRPCPFCGAEVKPEERFCEHCGEKVVIETMRLARLEISGGGSLVIGAGGSMQVIGRRVIPAHEAALAGDVAAIKAAVVDGDDPNHPDEHGRTPLHYAAYHGHLDALRYLLSLGAEADRADDDGRTPLHHAAWTGHADAVSTLLSVGASTQVRDNNGQRAADLALQHGHVELGSRL